MKLLTETQKKFLFRREVTEGMLVPFPSHECYVYRDGEKVSILLGAFETIDPLYIKKITEDGMCLVNFAEKPSHKDFQISKEDLSRRDLTEMILLALFCTIPFMLYNLFVRAKNTKPVRSAFRTEDFKRGDILIVHPLPMSNIRNEYKVIVVHSNEHVLMTAPYDKKMYFPDPHIRCFGKNKKNWELHQHRFTMIQEGVTIPHSVKELIKEKRFHHC